MPEGAPPRILLPETEDSRIRSAVEKVEQMGFCRPLLWGEREIRANESRVRAHLEARLVKRGKDPRPAEDLAKTPAIAAAASVALGLADAAIMGAVYTTGETVRAALTAVELAPGIKTLTSCFWMLQPDRSWIFADGGVVPDPSPEQLADIAILSAGACRRYLGEEPRVALLSFSSHGSATHPAVEKVQQAVGVLRVRRPDFALDGELQLDAAIVPEVARAKAPDSPLQGQANVLVFPDLNSGNIGYKLVQRLAGARAIGPLLLGLSAPIHDLSRGCSVEDIIEVMAVATLDFRGADCRGAQ